MAEPAARTHPVSEEVPMTKLGRVLIVGALAFPALAAAQPSGGAATPPVTAPIGDAASTRADIRRTFGFVPIFLERAPDALLPGAWADMKGLWLNPNTALPPRTKELIGVAVAGQVPCRYCSYGHTALARAQGATDVEIGEAVAMAAVTRKWSTMLNGMALDETKFRAEIGQMLRAARSAAGKPRPAPLPITDAASALRDIQQQLGVVPDFLRRYPAEGLPGAWVEWRDVELDPRTAIAPRFKSLVGLAVSAQIPCHYCVTADTEFARFEGASDREIAEAIAMAAMVRHWSTILNGLQIDEAAFRRDMDRLAQGVRRAPAQGRRAPTRPR
jgi:AhpD family alkylhydroperoxidase